MLFDISYIKQMKKIMVFLFKPKFNYYLRRGNILFLPLDSHIGPKHF